MRTELTVILVCGSHTSVDAPYVYAVMDMYLFWYGSLMVVTGSAPCTDTAAEDWARSRQQVYVGFPAEWTKYGRAAGVKRNREMASLAQPNLVAAFYGQRGTLGMISHADKVGIPVQKWGWPE